MCRPASFVVTKDRVFWSPNGDSHELIIAENELKESNIRSEIQFVRVEICPPGGDFRMPLEKWRYKTDQDRLPDWYVEPEEEKRVRAVLPDWLKEKVILPDQSVETVAGSVLAIYGKVKYICDSATVENVSGKAVICTYKNLSPDILKSSKAVMIDRSNDTVVCYVGKD